MDKHYSEWTCYIAGALLTLMAKLARSVVYEMRQGKSFKQAFLEWFYVQNETDAASWVATIGVVWLGGSAYIDRMGFPNLELLASIPVVHSFAFFLGFVMEVTAPAFAKWFIKKIPGVQP